MLTLLVISAAILAALTVVGLIAIPMLVIGSIVWLVTWPVRLVLRLVFGSLIPMIFGLGGAVLGVLAVPMVLFVAVVAVVGAFDRAASPENRASLIPVGGNEAGAVAPEPAAQLRLGEPPVVGRVERGRLRVHGGGEDDHHAVHAAQSLLSGETRQSCKRDSARRLHKVSPRPSLNRQGRY